MKKRLFWLRRHQAVMLLLFLAGVSLAGAFTQRYHWQWDLTQNARHTLSPVSLKMLEAMPGTLQVTAYATLHDPQYGDLRQPIRDFVARYQRLKPDLKFKFVDPAQESQLARAAGIQVNGELVLSYRGRSEHLVTLNEQDFANTLMRLARDRERLVMALAGHGERRLDGGAPHDLGEFGRQLAHKGFRGAALNLAVEAEVPADVGVLLLTQPQTGLLPGEAEKIKRYLARGGNLLWLIEPGVLHGLEAVAEALNLALLPGVVIDPAAKELGFAPATAVAAQYGPHAVTARFDLVTIFPQARAIGGNDDPAWHFTPLIETAARSWLESGPADEHAAFDPGRDVAGPVVIGQALERDVEDGHQRIAVIGSGEFLANAYLGNGGNLDLGVNLVNWLAGDGKLIAIQPKTTLDARLELDKSTAVALALGFLLGVPALFFGAAIVVWRRRHA